MLADEQPGSAVGTFDTDLHLPMTFLNTVLDFIAKQLPFWRDDPIRRRETAETRLTGQLCRFLNGAARKSKLDHIDFQTEFPDAVKRSRTIDLSPAPRGCTIWIGGRQYTPYDALFPIECKRLPTPVARNRERREYLHTFVKKGGGVQRFREGLHGADHSIGAIIGYVQTSTAQSWFAVLNRWIAAFERRAIAGWSHKERLDNMQHCAVTRTLIASSRHPRSGTPIVLRHILIEM